MINRINRNYNERVQDYHAMISDEYRLYVNNISKMAASLPCCLYLLALYDSLKPDKVLDLGTGISSYCLRLFKKLNNLDTEIWSIDSSASWLEKSKEYCSGHGLDTDNFKTWDDFKDHEGRFDLIFVDIDMSPKRKLYLAPTFDQFSKEGTFIYLDDMHKSVIGYSFEKLMKTKQHKEYDIKELTLDEFGRFSRLVCV